MKYKIEEDDDITKFYVGNELIEEFEFELIIPFPNDIHPYHRKQFGLVRTILADNNIHLNVIEVPIVDDIGNEENGEFRPDDLVLPTLEESEDGCKYFLIQDTEMGRGWAVLGYDDSSSIRHIIYQDHRDNVLDVLLRGDFIKSFKIDYGYV